MSRAALEQLLAGHKAKLDRIVALSAEEGHNRAQQRCLDALADRAQALLKGIELERANIANGWSADSALGYWGRNGRGPEIDDMAASAEFHADNARAAILDLEFKALGNGRFGVAA